MSDLLDRLQDMVDFKHDDMDVAREAIEEITRLRAEQGEVRGYLSRLLQSLHPSIEILPDLLGVCTQIDNVLAGQMEDITRLRATISQIMTPGDDYKRLNAALATARREGMEESAKRLEELHKNHNYDPESGTLTKKLGRYDRWPESAKTAKLEHDTGYYRAIAEGVAHILRAAAKEGKP